MDADEREPIEAVLHGMRLHPLDDNWTALYAFVLVKCLDEEGDPVWSFRTSESPNLEELLGALEVQVGVLRRKLVRQWDEE